MTSPLQANVFSAVVEAPFGAIGIRTAESILKELVYLPPHWETLAPIDAVAERTTLQLQRYLREPDCRFDLPLAIVGTAFQQRVWAMIAAVPRGHTTTYGAIAKALRTAPRAVGQACGANWFPVVIPCHRVTAASGLGGFAHSDDETGFQLGVKKWLLAHEAHVNG